VGEGDEGGEEKGELTVGKEEGMQMLGDLVRSILATQAGRDGDGREDSGNSPRQAPLWAGFALNHESRSVKLAAIGLDRGDTIRATGSSESVRTGDSIHVMDVTRNDSPHEFGGWLCDAGDFVATEAEAEWERLLKEMKDQQGVLATTLATVEAIRGDLAKVPGLAPCPSCGESRRIGLKACMAPGGTRCCPWVRCEVCQYAGPRGIDRPGTEGTGENTGQPAMDAAVEAVRAWNAGDVDLVAFAAVTLKDEGESRDAAWQHAYELIYQVMEGGIKFRELLATAGEKERRSLGMIARVMRRRMGEIEEAIG
jgi:hypothetical protein